MRLVRDLCGSNEATLRRKLDIERGTLRHHLVALQSAGVLQSVALGRETHYFPREYDAKRMLLVAHARHGRAWEVLQQVLVEPGISQGELAERMGMTRKVLRQQLDVLHRADLVETVIQGRFRLHFPGQSVDECIRNMATNLVPGALDAALKNRRPPDPPRGPA